MAKYAFQAKSIDGKIIKGNLDGASSDDVRNKLRSKQLVPVNISLVTQAGDEKISNISLKQKDLQIFTRQFASMIEAGVPIIQTLESLKNSGTNLTLISILNKIILSLQKGSSFTEALKDFPRSFDEIYVSLVKAGEEGGALGSSMARLAIYIEKSTKMKSKIKGAMYYPIAVISISSIVVSGLLLFVIPNFASIFDNSKGELPALTQFMIDISDWMKSSWPFLFFIGISVPVGITFYYRTPKGRENLDGILLSLPLFGNMIRKNAIARFSGTLASLLSSGVRIVSALEISAKTCGNKVLEQIISRSIDQVKRGKNLSDALRDSKEFPPMVSQMISVGEESGGLESMLYKVSEFYEEEMEIATESLTSLINPIMIFVLGAIIAVVILAMYLPVFNLAGAFG